MSTLFMLLIARSTLLIDLETGFSGFSGSNYHGGRGDAMP
jgi:hypothetical protein